jgi:hypothetical protein
MTETWLDQYPFVRQLLQAPEEELVGYPLEGPSARPPVAPDPTLCRCPLCGLTWGEPEEE